MVVNRSTGKRNDESNNIELTVQFYYRNILKRDQYTVDLVKYKLTEEIRNEIRLSFVKDY